MESCNTIHIYCDITLLILICNLKSPDEFFENFGNALSVETLVNEKTKTIGDLVENMSILSNWIYMKAGIQINQIFNIDIDIAPIPKPILILIFIMKENYNCDTHVTSNDFLVEESSDFMSSLYDQDNFSVIIID